ncbi:MAG TPA: hypothetical protein VKR54_03510 [Candidatus Babeliales bacterium]|jgi:hypothetical protein|nr:hypothetical protein [Candidatus Babeliales bacterium]
MRSFNNCIAIILLHSAGFVCAKQIAPRGQATSQAKKTTSIKEPQPKEQTASPVKTYKDLLEEIKNKMKPATVWDGTNKKLNDQFVTAIVKNAKDANLTFIECEALLQAARNFHAPFTNNNAENVQILTNVNNQIVNIKKDFIEATPPMVAAPKSRIIEPIAPKKALLPQPEPAAKKAIVGEPKPATQSRPSLTEPTTQQPIAITVPKEPQPPFTQAIVELQVPEKLKQSEEQPEPHYTEPMVQGIFALEMFRKSSPKTFGATLYVNGELNKKWLVEALKTILNNATLTEKNRMIIQEELSKNGTAMIKELLQNNKNTTPEQLKKIVNNVHNQVVRFINEQLTKGVQPAAQPELRQRVKLKSQELAQAKLPIELPAWIVKKDAQNYSFNCTDLERAVIAYIKENSKNPEIVGKNAVIKTPAVVNNFAKQVPSTIPSEIRIVIIKQMEDCIADLIFSM